MTRHHNDPQTMQYISKHFYCEKVYDDSTSDWPKIRWRYRNFFSDDVAHAQRTRDNDPKNNLDGNSHQDSSNHDSSSHSYGEPDDKGSALEFKPVFVSAIIQLLSPFASYFFYDCLLIVSAYIV